MDNVEIEIKTENELFSIKMVDGSNKTEVNKNYTSIWII